MVLNVECVDLHRWEARMSLSWYTSSAAPGRLLDAFDPAGEHEMSYLC